MLVVSSAIRIPLREFDFSFVRSSGPGGQNVNKVNSKAVLRWNPFLSASIPAAVLTRFLNRFQSRITNTNEIVIMSDRFRDQLRNQADCLEKIKEMLLVVEHPPKVRKKTKPSFSSRVKTKNSNKSHSLKKKNRQKPRFDD